VTVAVITAGRRMAAPISFLYLSNVSYENFPMLKTLQNFWSTLSLSSSQDTHEYPKTKHRKLVPPHDSRGKKGKP
jgi:hypothetical protein